MLFELRLREGIHDGTITLAFRRWRRTQVVAGHHYRTGLDLVEAQSVDQVAPADIDAAQARAAGFGDVAELLASLRGDSDLPLYRIRFRRLDEPDPRDVLAARAALSARDIAAIDARLARLDRLSTRGPWTAAVLGLISAQPATSSVVFAETLGWERQDLKRHIRHLKELGLTISLAVGYRLSPRGEAYLRALPARSAPS